MYVLAEERYLGCGLTEETRRATEIVCCAFVMIVAAEMKFCGTGMDCKSTIQF
jgi:hypothetical protein